MSPLNSPGVCVWDPGAGWICRQDLRRSRIPPKRVNTLSYCFVTSNIKQIYDSNSEKICTSEGEYVYPYVYPLGDCFLTADLGQLITTNFESYCPL